MRCPQIQSAFLFTDRWREKRWIHAFRRILTQVADPISYTDNCYTPSVSLFENIIFWIMQDIQLCIALSAGAVEYTDCFSAEG